MGALSRALDPIRHPRVVIAVLSLYAIYTGIITWWRPSPGVHLPAFASALFIASGIFALGNIWPLHQLTPHTRRILTCTSGTALTSAYLLRSGLLIEAAQAREIQQNIAVYMVGAGAWFVAAYMTFIAWAGIIVPWARSSSPSNPPCPTK